MRYQEILDQLQTGDVIMVMGREGALTPFTKFFTRSPYTHVGQVFQMGGEWWLHEINGGKNHAVPLAQLREDDFDVYHKPEQVDDAMLRAAIATMLQTRINYGFVALFVIGLFDYLRVQVFIHWRRILVCSGYIAKTLCMAG